MYDIQSNKTIDSDNYFNVALSVDTIQNIDKLVDKFKDKNCLAGN